METNNNILWKTVFLAMIFGALTLIVSLSVFFYVRSREPIWDNRSGVSRLIAINKSYDKQLGTEVFTMFGSQEITLNGEPINDESTLYIGNGGILFLEITGVSRGETSGTVSSYSSKVLVNRKVVNTLTPLDGTGSSLSATEIELSPIDGVSGTILVELVGSRVEFRGSWVSAPPETRNFILKVQVTGWYP